MPKRGNLSEIEQYVIQSLTEEKIKMGKGNAIKINNKKIKLGTDVENIGQNTMRFENFSEKNYSRKALWYGQE
ncbi:hypothetical protein A3Q56_05695 [Intoshia linei]|uniref:Uncharacterized protein n=1 Tax=Intoshia linei TaxID=1819745 RepID=A0A177AZH4_9BILA|nr:hypothetical protein A3Q56_05695 [Intoshia linei]